MALLPLLFPAHPMDPSLLDNMLYFLFSFLNLSVYPLVLTGIMLVAHLRKADMTDYLESSNLVAWVLLIFYHVSSVRYLWYRFSAPYWIYLSWGSHLQSVVFPILDAVVWVLFCKKQNRRSLSYSVGFAVIICSKWIWYYVSELLRSFLPSSWHMDEGEIVSTIVTQTCWYALCTVVTAQYLNMMKHRS